MPEERKSIGSVTALSVVGLVFGLIGMLGSFIPCIGSLAYFVGIPAAVVSGIALYIAQTNNGVKSFAIAALTISLIGVAVSGFQYFSIVSAGKKAQQELEAMSQPRFEERQAPPQPQQPAPAAVVDTSGLNIVQQEAAAPANSEEAKAQFVKRIQAMLASAPDGKWMVAAKEVIIGNPREWQKIPIVLGKGISNTVKIESGKHSFVLLRTCKSYEGKDMLTGKTFVNNVEGEPEGIDSANSRNQWWSTYNSKTGSFDNAFGIELTFQASYKDFPFAIYVPTAYKNDYKITLGNARVGQ